MKPKAVNRNDLYFSKTGPIWKHCYKVRLGITYFIVNADHERDALDYVMDYISSHKGYKGFWASFDPSEHDSETNIICGNYGYVLTLDESEIDIQPISWEQAKSELRNKS
jgi:hypothetical protein